MVRGGDGDGGSRCACDCEAVSAAVSAVTGGAEAWMTVGLSMRE
jgi:hypothetical protein